MSIQTQAEIGYLWSYPVAIVFYFILPERQAWAVNAPLLAMVIPSAWQVFEDAITTSAAVTFLRSIYFQPFLSG